MKHIAISSLLFGTVIILAPIAHSLIEMALMAHLLAQNPSGHFSFSGMLQDSYPGWCLFLGFCLLVTGTVMGFLGGRTASSPAGKDMAALPQPHHA